MAVPGCPITLWQSSLMVNSKRSQLQASLTFDKRITGSIIWVCCLLWSRRSEQFCMLEVSMTCQTAQVYSEQKSFLLSSKYSENFFSHASIHVVELWHRHWSSGITQENKSSLIILSSHIFILSRIRCAHSGFDSAQGYGLLISTLI